MAPLSERLPKATTYCQRQAKLVARTGQLQATSLRCKQRQTDAIEATNLLDCISEAARKRNKPTIWLELPQTTRRRKEVASKKRMRLNCSPKEEEEEEEEVEMIFRRKRISVTRSGFAPPNRLFLGGLLLVAGLSSLGWTQRPVSGQQEAANAQQNVAGKSLALRCE